MMATTFRMAMLAASMAALIFSGAAIERATAADTPSASASDAVQRAIDFLATKGQAPDGSFSAQAGPGVTALVVTGVLRNGRTADDPMVARALQYLQGFVHPDGGIYTEGSTHRNYETSLALMAFSEANRDGRYDALMENATKFLKGIQWGAGDDVQPSDLSYGGAGYGSHKRPDLSNTSFFIDALRAAGVSQDDEAIQRALIFVSRCQNLESPYNPTSFPTKNPDGGFYYTVAAGGSSQAGETPNGGLRSYGSMTYAGLKSMIFAGVDKDDPRVTAAVEWIRQHYSLQDNPGMGDAGLYYYYHTFAKALDALGTDVLSDQQGRTHDWRTELINQLVSVQNPDGSWVNSNERWLEGDRNLVTGYALLALAFARQP